MNLKNYLRISKHYILPLRTRIISDQNNYLCRLFAIKF